MISAKGVALLYVAVLVVTMGYALFSAQRALLWAEILVGAVVLFVLAGAWYSFRLPKVDLSDIAPFNIFAFIAVAVVLALVAPQERTLGGYIRLIYIHAAVTWVGLALFAASFVAGGANLLIKDKAPAKWADSLFVNAIFFWAASSLIGTVAAYLTWGESWYFEPRTRAAFTILVVALIVYVVGPMMESHIVRMSLQTAVPALVFLLLALTGKLVHPNNAFLKSDSLEIKLFALIITLVFLGVAAQGVRWNAARRGL